MSGKAPVRLVLFDVFDTLCTPRLPVHEQYHEEAIRANLPADSISSQSVRAAFKPAFREMEEIWPLYGKHTSPPLSPEEWWTQLIRRCMINAGAANDVVEECLPSLSRSLLARFESDKGYRNFPETIACLDELQRLGVKTSIISNADPRILNTLESLGILSRITHPPILSWDIEAAKPDAQIYQAARKACGEEIGEGVLMVGDELRADYRGSTQAGLEGRLIRREEEWSDGARRSGDEDLADVAVVTGLEEIVQEVKLRNGFA